MFPSCGLSDILLDVITAVVGVWGGVRFPLVMPH